MALYLSSLTNVNKFYSETLLMCLKNWQHALVNVRPQESYSFRLVVQPQSIVAKHWPCELICYSHRDYIQANCGSF